MEDDVFTSEEKEAKEVKTVQAKNAKEKTTGTKRTITNEASLG